MKGMVTALLRATPDRNSREVVERAIALAKGSRLTGWSVSKGESNMCHWESMAKGERTDEQKVSKP